MRRESSVLPFCALVALLSWGAPSVSSAQVISLRTTPLAAGDQFEIFPSANLGMAGPSIAMNDGLFDPFQNPAKGAAVDVSRVFSAPMFYNVSDGNGGASTFPVGLQLTSESWFGGGLVAIQQMDMGDGLGQWPRPMAPGSVVTFPPSTSLANNSSVNRYGQLSMGRRLSSRVSVGASVFFADLAQTDGVEQLFANAWDIEEFGHVADFRLGLTAELDGDRTVEAVLVHNRVNMTHDVTSVTWELVDTMQWLWEPEVLQEENLNHSTTWGGQLGYTQALDNPEWRMGGRVTVNRKQHPKIPTYDLANVEGSARPPIPRDPGDSWAFDLGFGLAYHGERSTFGLDLVFEPAVSDTWADSPTDLVSDSGTVIPAGAHTVDNHFVFSNTRANLGFSHELGSWNLQFGVGMKAFDYRLEQDDHIREIDRRQTEQWIEWTPTWGVRFPIDELELRYIGHASSSSHFPWPDGPSGVDVLNAGAMLEGGDILAPPPGDLVTRMETVVTHRIQVSIPFG